MNRHSNPPILAHGTSFSVKMRDSSPSERSSKSPTAEKCSILTPRLSNVATRRAAKNWLPIRPFSRGHCPLLGQIIAPSPTGRHRPDSHPIVISLVAAGIASASADQSACCNLAGAPFARPEFAWPIAERSYAGALVFRFGNFGANRTWRLVHDPPLANTPRLREWDRSTC
jgi:hypothetical protein